MTRAIILDTETTGLEPHFGHRVIEVAAIEIINDLPTGAWFHALIDPERDIPEEATRVHGYTAKHLSGKPVFASIFPDLWEFFGDGALIAHNAPFDFAFLDAELERLGRSRIDPARMVDTLALAKSRFPGLPNSLDALCRRFGIDLSERNTHNALLDCRLLARVYIELTGGRQRGLALEVSSTPIRAVSYTMSGPRELRPVRVTEAELVAHAAFIARLKEPLWTAA